MISGDKRDGGDKLDNGGTWAWHRWCRTRGG